MTGIYAIENIENGKMYVGQAVDLAARWKQHLYRPFNPNSDQYDGSLYEEIRTLGIHNFSFRVLEVCEKEDLNEREKYWINFYQSDYRETGYNRCSGGEGASGSGIMLDRVEARQIQDLLLTSDISQWDIAEQFSVNQATVSYINTGTLWNDPELDYPLRKRASAKKYYCVDCGKEIWRGSERCQECAALYRSGVAQRPSKEELTEVLLRDNGNFTKAGDYYGVTDNCVRKWCRYYDMPVYSKHYKKDVCEKKHVEIRPVQQIDPDSGIIIAKYRSASHAFSETGISHVSDVCNGKRKYAGGYIWRFDD